MKRRTTRNAIEQEFNLRKLLGQRPTEAQKELFYNLVVDKMVQRTAEGKDINNKKFRPYNADYAKDKGVTRTSVDLILTGEMLNSFDDSTTRDKVKISVDSDQVDKAYGHISGMKGHPFIKNGKVRDFFGFKSKNDINDIIQEVKQVEGQGKDNPIINLAELRRQVQGIAITNVSNNRGSGDDQG